MKERLVIKNFGPIKSVDLELGKMTILIGEQATGKSTIAKVLAVCRYFSYITSPDDNNNIYVPMFQGLRDWDIEGYLSPDSEIFYDNEDYSYKIHRYDQFNINFKLDPKSDRFKKLVEEYRRLYSLSNISDNDIDKWVPDSNFYLLNIKRIMNNPFFFPTERGLQSIFSLGKSSISNMSDSLFNQFALLDKISSNFKSETEINPLDIYYKYENNQGFIRSEISQQYFPLWYGDS